MTTPVSERAVGIRSTCEPVAALQATAVLRCAYTVNPVLLLLLVLLLQATRQLLQHWPV